MEWQPRSEPRGVRRDAVAARGGAVLDLQRAGEGEDGEAEGAELAEALSWHGVATLPAARLAVPCSTGAALLAVANIGVATLIVMGDYTHSRLRQDLLGGVTREVLADATIPVSMSH